MYHALGTSLELTDEVLVTILTVKQTLHLKSPATVNGHNDEGPREMTNYLYSESFWRNVSKLEERRIRGRGGRQDKILK